MEKSRDLLRDPAIRLLTITGPPGVGKTRLALEVAAHVAPHFEDGTAFVDLAPLRESAAVPLAIARALGMADRSSVSLLIQLQDRLQGMHLLLLLDNFEHLMEAAPQVGTLLAHCPDLKVLTTSRESLRLSWEHAYVLSPLEAPDPTWLARPETALRYPAVALFAERARAGDPEFSVDARNGKAVAAICRRLDGLPLAIELAAARIKLFSPEALLTRLESGLGVLVGGARDVTQRHRTLRDAITWSYDLLAPQEQKAFRRLAVFAGGCTLEAAYASIPEAAGDTLEIISSLVDKSLVVQGSDVGGEPRFRMLETIREFALERLASAGELAEAQRRHATFFLALAEQADPELRRAQVGAWLARLEREADNFRAALDWAHKGDPQMALRMAVTLGEFWRLRGRLSEGRTRLEAVLATAGAAVTPEARANALVALGRLVRFQGDYAKALACAEEALAIRRSLGDLAGMASSLHLVGLTLYSQGDLTRAGPIFEEGVGLGRASGDRIGLARALHSVGAVRQRQGEFEPATRALKEALAIYTDLDNVAGVAGVLGSLGIIAQERGDLETARRYHEQHVGVSRQIGGRQGLIIALNNLGEVLRDLGEIAGARAAIEESLSFAREDGDTSAVAFALDSLGGLARARGDVAEAIRMYSEALQIRRSLGEKLEISRTLDNMATLAMVGQDPSAGVRLSGAASALRQSIGAGLSRAEAPVREALEAARKPLGEKTYQAAWQAGEALSLDQAVEYALAWATRAAAKPAVRETLSRREREVAVLIARGLTNRQIATELFVSVRTADTHVQHIFNKLGFSTRAQIATWVTREGLDLPTQ